MKGIDWLDVMDLVGFLCCGLCWSVEITIKLVRLIQSFWIDPWFQQTNLDLSMFYLILTGLEE
jgi:hypothetical protein